MGIFKGPSEGGSVGKRGHRNMEHMNSTEIQQALDRVFDQAIVFHGFTDYMRDYEVVTLSVAPASTGISPMYERYIFRHCVVAHVTTEMSPEIWRKSLDDELIAAGIRAGEGFQWGIRWQCIYPGARLVQDSEDAARWSEAVGIDFHEVVIETNGHRLRLVFGDLSVVPAQVGYTPFVVNDP